MQIPDGETSEISGGEGFGKQVRGKHVHVCTGVAQHLKTFQVIEIEVKE